jgi:two-component system response regulator AlgR
MKLKILLVDDEAHARARLKSLLANCNAPGVQVLAEAANSDQALAALQNHHFDLVLLDIGMPGINGLVLAKAMQGLSHFPALVFVTAHAEHALTAFDLSATDYLTKPVRQERLQQALQKVQRQLSSSTNQNDSAAPKVLIIQDRGRTERVPLTSVLYLKAELKYITVRTALRSFILEGSLNDLEEKYSKQFLRVHRNALVARQAMLALEKHFDTVEGESWSIHLHGLEDRGEALAVSRRQLYAVRQALLA